MVDKIGRLFRFVIRLVSAFTIRHARIIAASFIAGFFLFFLISQTVPFVLPYLTPEVKTIGIVGVYSPSTLPYSIQRLIGMGLTEIDERGEPKPATATSWEATDSGKRYIFHLRSDLIWHDGKNFTSSDVNYNISGVEFVVVDDHTLEVKLKEPFAPLPILLSRPLFRGNLSGLGPYKVVALELNGDMVRLMKLKPLTPQYPALTIRFYTTESLARTAFKLGEVAILEDQLGAGELESWKNVKVEERVDHTHYVALFYNTKDPLLSDRTVRQGLNFAVPTLDSEPATGPISPLSWAYSNKVRQYKFDLVTAERLLDKTATSTSSATLTLSTFPTFLPLANRIAQSWQSLGITVNVKIESAVPDNYQVLLGSQEIPPDPDQYPFWHSTQVANISRIDNKRIDKLLEDGRKTINKNERLKIYADFQRFLAEEAPAAFLYYPKVYTVRRK